MYTIMNEPNDPKLCLAMARMVPEKIVIIKGINNGVKIPLWKPTPLALSESSSDDEFDNLCVPILETEWLYVMQLVEQTLTEEEREQYLDNLCNQLDITNLLCDWSQMCNYRILHATFNQRARAMCEVKGITLE